jgi:hypothetical protein
MMEKAINLEEGLPDLCAEQMKNLCKGTDLAELMKNPIKNKDSINMVLRFIQKRVRDTSEKNRLISFKDILPPWYSEKTITSSRHKLLKFMEENNDAEYGDNLKTSKYI